MATRPRTTLTLVGAPVGTELGLGLPSDPTSKTLSSAAMPDSNIKGTTLISTYVEVNFQRMYSTHAMEWHEQSAHSHTFHYTQTGKQFMSVQSEWNDCERALDIT